MRRCQLIVIALLTVACDSTKPSPPAPSVGTGSAVRMQSDSYYGGIFSPTTLNTTVGTTVTWTNADSQTHQTVSDTGVWNGGDVAPTRTFSFTFATPGSYPYKCLLHPGMSGTVVVQ